MSDANTQSQITASLLRELTERDGETGLFTSTRVYRMLLGEVARSERYGNPLSCMLLRLRGLSSAPEDARLKMASRLADVMRNTDFAAVWNPNEFLVVLPETTELGAQAFSRKLDQVLTELGSTFGIGIEMSIATLRKGDDADEILRRLSSTGSPDRSTLSKSK